METKEEPREARRSDHRGLDAIQGPLLCMPLVSPHHCPWESSQLFSLFVTRSQVLGRDACALDVQGRGNITAFKRLQREVKNWLPPIPYTGEFSPNGRGDGMLGSQKGKECPVQVQTGGGRGRKMLWSTLGKSFWEQFSIWAREGIDWWQSVCVLVTQSCPTLCDPTDWGLTGSSIYVIFQTSMLEWVAIPFSRGIFLTQGSNLGLPNCRQTLYHLSHWSGLERE